MEGSNICGLIGMAGSLTVKHERAFDDLLIVDSVRGVDSVGVAAVHAGGSTTVHKKAMYPHDYLNTTMYKNIMKRDNRVLLGHNRWATKGKVNNINAHPFEFKTLIGAHNGTLRGQYLLPDSKDFEIDSENIFHAIDKEGIVKTYRNINGAAALVYYNKVKQSINFIRNKERPLFYTFSEDRSVIFWASESWMLSGILRKHNIKITNIVSTQEDTHYELSLDGIKKGDVLSKLRIMKLEPYVPYFEKVVNDYSHRFSQNKPKKKDKKNVLFPVGTSIRFCSKEKNITLASHYMDCYLASDPKVSVRLFLNSSCKGIHDAIKKLDDYEFIGRVNGYDSDRKILIQANSVTVVEKHKADVVTDNQKKQSTLDDYINFGGTMLNKKEFEALPAAAKDCCWCSSPIQFEEGNTIINGNNTLCKGCADIDEVKFYLDPDGTHNHV